MYLAKYLLSIEEFMDKEKGEALMERAFSCVDDTRRRKAEAMRPGRARAASLGAGLLLQTAVREAVCAFGGNVSGQGACVSGCNGASQMYGLKRYSVTQLLTCIEKEPRLPLTYEYGEMGKPCFQGYPFHFSLSHSGEYVLCVLSDAEIGADIQQHCGKNVGKLARRFYSPREAAAIEQAGAATAGEQLFYSIGKSAAAEVPAGTLFYRLWARKEAYGKLTGRGVAEVISIDLLSELATGFLSETILPGGERLIWEEYSSEKDYSIALCRYG